MNDTRSIQRRTDRLRAITLAEMLVVLGLIIVILGLAVPAFSVWENRKISVSINQCTALLKGIRNQAITERRVAGLFFYVDPRTQAQMIAPIEPALDPVAPDLTVDRYRPMDKLPFKLPRPMRLTPTAATDPLAWSDPQLQNEDLRQLSGPGAPLPPYDGTAASGSQFHRNFFVILFGPDGALQPGHRASIWDPDPTGQEVPEAHPGHHTGLMVSGAAHALAVNVVIAIGDPQQEPALLFEAANGLLLYNDADLRDAGTEQQKYLRSHAESLSIHAHTGRVHLGRPSET